MDLIGGLTAARLALDLAKDLREIDRSVDDATFKLKLADLTSALADAQVALSDAKVRINELETAVDVAANGEICPKCREGRLDLIETKPQHMMAMQHFGVEIWKYRCNEVTCGFEQKTIHDPHGVVPKTAHSAR